ncbi:hypothetical protein SAMN02745158_02549 [Lactonifactor longoviformis DSM 17459]|uniref:Vitamin B12 dependent methionine synthase, activation domain n=2 Tax=Lactonifactor TaxID=420345 RepID=A0A1M4YYW3_9CLOT|nr:hypothetical protein SAMN02745158_02549 [Lactonifactor longoviformis DSM 17459]
MIVELVKTITAFDFTLEKERVFRTAECYPGMPSYKKAETIYPEIVQGLRNAVSPCAWICFGKTHWYCLLTLGSGAEPYVVSCAKDTLLKGLLADKAAEELLFSMDSTVAAAVKAECRRREVGIKRRLEAPEQLPWKAQQIILKKIEKNQHTGVTVSGSYVFHPPRSMGYILELTHKQDCFAAVHDCSTCKNKECLRRNGRQPLSGPQVQAAEKPD